MSGTFSSFGSALSALRYNRVAMDVASNNISNSLTEGYTRRTAQAQATGAPAVQALWSKWNGYAGGVEVGGVERMNDPLLDRRARLEHAELSFLNTRAASLVRFETTLGEPSDNGVAAALSAFKAGWGDVANAPADEAARNQLIGRAEILAAAVQAQDRSIANEWSDQRTRLTSVVDEANTVASDLAQLNGALRSAYVAETDASTLLDRRDQLTLRLAQLTGAKTTVGGDYTVTVSLGGKDLVSNTTAYALEVMGPASMTGSTADTVTVAVEAAAPASTVTAPQSGELLGVLDVLNKDLPAYRADLDSFVNTLRTAVNAGQAVGVDLDGTAGATIFTGTSAADLAVSTSLTPRNIAAASAAVGGLDTSNADAIASQDLGAAQYRSMVTRLGVTVASVQRVADNQKVLTDQVDASRESLAGVSIDEEMVNLLAAQRAYEGASRVITTLDSVLDTLINRTGLTR
ncbi:MAG: flagellar hook-associated protein FlgK [Actinomycetota bacterium]